VFRLAGAYVFDSEWERVMRKFAFIFLGLIFSALPYVEAIARVIDPP
jgi:hypothetical protein